MHRTRVIFVTSESPSSWIYGSDLRHAEVSKAQGRSRETARRNSKLIFTSFSQFSWLISRSSVVTAERSSPSLRASSSSMRRKGSPPRSAARTAAALENRSAQHNHVRCTMPSAASVAHSARSPSSLVPPRKAAARYSASRVSRRSATHSAESAAFSARLHKHSVLFEKKSGAMSPAFSVGHLKVP